MKLAFLFALAAALTGCATVHEGHKAKVATGDSIPGLEISAQETSGGEGGAFALYTVTFENLSDQWVRIDTVEVEMSPEMAKTHSVVVGDDLVAWAEANEDKQRLEKYNTDWIKTGLYSVGIVAALAGGKNSVARPAGLALLGGTALYDVGSKVVDKRNSIIAGKTVPSKHLYAPFAVPGKLFLRRWVLINKPSNSELSNLALAVKTVDGRTSHVSIALNDSAKSNPNCKAQGVYGTCN